MEYTIVVEQQERTHKIQMMQKEHLAKSIFMIKVFRKEGMD